MTKFFFARLNCPAVLVVLLGFFHFSTGQSSIDDVTPQPPAEEEIFGAPATGRYKQFRGFFTPRPPPEADSGSYIFSSVWAGWSAWSFCSEGVQVRVRACNTVRGFSCPGQNKEQQPCLEEQLERRFRVQPAVADRDYDGTDPWADDRKEALRQLSLEPPSEKAKKPAPVPFAAQSGGRTLLGLVPPGPSMYEGKSPSNANSGAVSSVALPAGPYRSFASKTNSDGSPSVTPELLFGSKIEVPPSPIEQSPQPTIPTPEKATIKSVKSKVVKSSSARNALKMLPKTSSPEYDTELDESTIASTTDDSTILSSSTSGSPETPPVESSSPETVPVESSSTEIEPLVESSTTEESVSTTEITTTETTETSSPITTATPISTTTKTVETGIPIKKNKKLLHIEPIDKNGDGFLPKKSSDSIEQENDLVNEEEQSLKEEEVEAKHIVKPHHRKKVINSGRRKGGEIMMVVNSGETHTKNQFERKKGALADDTRKALEWMLNNLDKEKRVINRPGNKSDRQLLHSGEALIPAGKRARILGSKFAHSNGQRVSVDSETGSKRSDSKVLEEASSSEATETPQTSTNQKNKGGKKHLDFETGPPKRQLQVEFQRDEDSNKRAEQVVDIETSSAKKLIHAEADLVSRDLEKLREEMSKMEQELAHIKNLEEKAAEKNVGGGKTNNNKISVDAMTGSMEKSAEADRIDRQQKPLHLPINIPAVGSMAAGISPAGSTNKKVKPISEKLGGNTTLSLPVNALRRSTIPYLPQQQQQKTTTTKQLITRATITINATPPTTTATSIAPSSTTSLSRKNNAKEESAKQREDKVRQMNDQLLSALLSGGEKQITLHTDVGEWSDWTDWGACVCRKQMRNRTCQYSEDMPSKGCKGRSYQTRPCTSIIGNDDDDDAQCQKPKRPSTTRQPSSSSTANKTTIEEEQQRKTSPSSTTKPKFYTLAPERGPKYRSAFEPRPLSVAHPMAVATAN